MRSLKPVIVLVILWQCSVGTFAQVSKRFFRADYTYFDSTESFYKIHTIHRTWHEAKKVCAAEGAHLFYPQDGNEADVATEFLKQNQPFSWVFVGASAILAKGVYETIDGVPVQSLYHNWAPGEPNDGYAQDCMVLRREGTLHDENCAMNYPFICKKTLATLQWNEECSMPNTDYQYSEQFGRCYKFHRNPMNWIDAFAACSAEQSYLAVIDSQEEADFLSNETKAQKTVEGDYLRGIVLVGFHNRTDEGWITIKGVPLVDSGFSDWGNGEPNGEGRELCGSLYYNGQLNDISCDTKSLFICEHDIERLSLSLDERFSSDSQDNQDEKVPSVDGIPPTQDNVVKN